MADGPTVRVISASRLLRGVDTEFVVASVVTPSCL